MNQLFREGFALLHTNSEATFRNRRLDSRDLKCASRKEVRKRPDNEHPYVRLTRIECESE